MFDQLAALLSAAGAVLWLNTDAIHQLQTAPNAVSLAIWILLLGTVSDVLGDSPLLFIHRIRAGRFLAALGIELVLSVIRLAIWLISFWILLNVLSKTSVRFVDVLVVTGLGYAPMLLSIFVVIPSAGLFIGRVLQAWTLVTMLTSIAVATGSNPADVLLPGLVVLLLILVVRRWSGWLTVALLGPISRRLVGIDVMHRTRAMDPRQVMSTWST